MNQRLNPTGATPMERIHANPRRLDMPRGPVSRIASAVAALGVLADSAVAWAQPANGAAVTEVVVTRSWILDAVIVAAVMLLALFAVCRSSRRN